MKVVQKFKMKMKDNDFKYNLGMGMLYTVAILLFINFVLLVIYDILS